MSACVAIANVIGMPKRRVNVPEHLRAAWEELMDLVEAESAAEEESRRRRARADELTVVLLRGGLRRQDLVENGMFSSAWVTKIQQREGLAIRPPRE